MGTTNDVHEYAKLRHFIIPTGPGGWSFCSCGAKVGPLDTFTRQREWHRHHRRQIAELKAALKRKATRGRK